MRQIINVQLGQTGNSVGVQFLERITQEHGIDSTGKYIGNNDYQRERVNVYFNELQTDQYTPRTILADLEPGTIDFVRGTPQGRIYDPDNFVTDIGSAGNNWAVGYYGKGSEMIDRLMDVVRKQSDACDHLQGFQVLHSMGGGTGSGLGSLLLQRIEDEYEDRLVQTFPIFPSRRVSDIVVEPYNTLLALTRQVQAVALCNVIQNEALYNLCEKKLKIKTPKYSEINAIISELISNITCGLRFPGQINSSLRKQAVNLIPFPRIHFFINYMAPLLEHNDTSRKNSPNELLSSLFSPDSFLSTVNPKDGYYLTASLMLRGKAASSQVQQLCRRKIYANSAYFLQWVPNNNQISLCDVAPADKSMGMSLTGNNSAVQQVFKKASQQFSSLFRRKAFVHWYTAQGMDQMQLVEVESNCNDLISQYNWNPADAYLQQPEQQIEQ